MKSLIIVIILFYFNPFWCQNVAENGSFEFFSSCPTNSGELSKALNWSNPTQVGTSDYYHRCNSIMNNLINLYQTPKDGDGVIGIYTFGSTAQNGREYAQNQMMNVLNLGECYLVKFYVNLLGTSMYATNNMGCFFSEFALNQTGVNYLLNYSPQILQFANEPIKDTSNWVSIAGIYESNGNENYIIIGNFMTDQNTTSQIVNNTGISSAYYFIDDVSVISISDLPNSMPAYAGADTSILVGDSVFIGQEISNLNCTWSVLGGDVIAANTSGIYVQPTETTTYVVEQNLCGVITYDSITVTLHGLGVSSLDGGQRWVTVMPNPNNGQFELALSKLNTEKATIQILDASGRIVFEQKDFLETKINTNLSKGVYFLKFENEQGIFEEKIVIQ